MKWGKDETSDSFNSARGFGEIIDNGSPNPSLEEGRCSTRRIVESTCKTEEVEPGKFIRKCDKTEKILRDCVGRPVEVVVSKTEHSEDDVTNEMTGGSLPPFDSSGVEPFTFPGFRGGIEAIDRGLRGDFEAIERGLAQFLDATEEMTDLFFKSFGIPSKHSPDEAPRRQLENDGSNRENESPYSEYAVEITEV